MSVGSVTLKNEVDILSGFAWKSSQFKKEQCGLPIIRIQNVGTDDSNFVYWNDDYNDRFVVKKGELLLTLSGSFRLAEWNGDDALLNQRILKLSPSENLDRRFFLHYMQTQLKRIERMGKHALVNNVSVTDIKNFQIPLPPLSEQKRIAEILDSVDALRTKRRESLSLLDNLIQSTFLEMFGDPVTNPMRWERRTLGEITAIKAPMVDPRKKEYRHLLHYGPDRIEKNTGELLPALTAEEDGLISGKFLCSPGEILYSKIRPYLNKVALVQQRCLCSADIYPVRPDDKLLTKEYLIMLLRSAAFLDYVAGFSRRANIPKVNRKQFAGYKAPLPPLSLQQRFSAFVKSMDWQKSRLKAHLAELDTLFASLQQRAFNGGL